MLAGCAKAILCRRCLFLLVMEALSALIRKADEWSLLQSLQLPATPHRASLYADDLIMFINPSPADMGMAKEIFLLFEGASGLGCNVAKCQVVAIRCEPD
jgi:hypothetical protein